MTTPIGKPEIANLIPHSGTMCLLDSVRSWDSTTIVCTASSHRDAHHPLASGGYLNSVCGIEYAAQAMAVHGGLTATGGKRPPIGYLGSLRDVACPTPPLDLFPGHLEVRATQPARDGTGTVYAFIVRSGTATILEGRATVVIAVNATKPTRGENTSPPATDCPVDT